MADELNESMRTYLEALKEEYGLYKALFEKARQERVAVENQDVDKLQTILKEKQMILEKTQAIEKEITNLRDLWKEAKPMIAPELSRDISDFLKKFSGFMKQLMDYEAVTESKFIEQNKKKEEEIKQIREKRKINKAYFNDVSPVPRNTNILG